MGNAQSTKDIATMDLDDGAAVGMEAQKSDLGSAAGTTRPRAPQLTLQDDDPFELDNYIAPYSERRRIERLLFVARNCLTLRAQAYNAVLDTIKKYSLDYKLYGQVLEECVDLGEEVKGDQAWLATAKSKQESGLDKLDVELKNYQNNLIKESIRMGYRDLGDFQRKSGDLQGAVRSYTKSRDYCTTSQHVLDMCVSVIDTALDQMSYATVRNYVLKAEAALSAIMGPLKPAGDGSSTSGPSSNGAGAASSGTTSASRGVNLPGMLASNLPGRREEEARSRNYQLLAEKLAVANAIANLGQSDFKKAARALLNLSPPPPSSGSNSSSAAPSARESASSNTSHYISPADIGLYGVLCGMATLDRGGFKRLVLDNASLRPYLEHSPFLKELIVKYHNSKFLPKLLAKIKAKMLELYFEPFRAVKIDRMARAFGWEGKVLEDELVRLIQSEDIKARIDKQDEIIVAHLPDERQTVYDKALLVAKETERSNRAMAWRMKLIQNDLIVDARKDSTVQPPQHQQGQQQVQHSHRQRTDTRSSAGGQAVGTSGAVPAVPTTPDVSD